MNGEEVRFDSPRDALAKGIATVYQDLAMVPLMSVWRNFFLGSEPTKSIGPLRWIDKASAKRIAKSEMAKMGIDIRDTEQPVGTLSGGERQSVAIARAGYFGAKVLILDEPTSALGVKQSGVVLKRIVEARNRGLAVIFITHNPRHAYPVGNRFLILNRGTFDGLVRQRGDLDRRADPVDGRRCRARTARARTARRHQPALSTDSTMSTRRRLGIGVVGFGWMGQAHSRSAARVASLFPERTFDIDLVLCADNVPASRDKAVDGFGFDGATDDWKAVIEHPDVDVVYVTAPNMMHEPVAIAAAEAGKAVFCEKPVGGTPAQTVRIAAAAHVPE